jgi:tight adherence protein C
MVIAISAFFVIFLLIASGGLLLFYRETMLQRITEVINPATKQKSMLSTIQQTGLSIGGVVEHFENLLPKSQAEVSVIKQRLIRAGFRKETAIKMFYGSKVLTPLILLIAAVASGFASMSFFVYIAALGIG